MPNPFDDLMKKYRKPMGAARNVWQNAAPFAPNDPVSFAEKYPSLSMARDTLVNMNERTIQAFKNLYGAGANIWNRGVLGLNAPYPTASFSGAKPAVSGGAAPYEPPLDLTPAAPPITQAATPMGRQYPVDPYEGRTPGPISTNIPGGVKEVPWAKDMLPGQYAGRALTPPGYVAPREANWTPSGTPGVATPMGSQIMDKVKAYTQSLQKLQGEKNKRTQEDNILFLARNTRDTGIKAQAAAIMAERNKPIEAKQKKEEIEAKTKAALGMVEAEEGIKAKYRPQQAIGKTLTPGETMTSASLSERANIAAEGVDLVKGGNANTTKFFDAAMADPTKGAYIQKAVEMGVHPRVLQLKADKWSYLQDQAKKVGSDPAKSKQINDSMVALFYEMLTDSAKYNTQG